MIRINHKAYLERGMQLASLRNFARQEPRLPTQEGPLANIKHKTNDPNWMLRKEAMEEVAKMITSSQLHPSQFIPLVREIAFKDPHVEVRKTAMYILVNTEYPLPEKAYDLLAAMNDPEPLIRLDTAVTILKNNEEKMQAMITAIGHCFWISFGTVRIIQRELNNPQENIQYKAIEAIKYLARNPSGTSLNNMEVCGLIETLREKLLNRQEYARVRKDVLSVLLELGEAYNTHPKKIEDMKKLAKESPTTYLVLTAKEVLTKSKQKQ